MVVSVASSLFAVESEQNFVVPVHCEGNRLNYTVKLSKLNGGTHNLRCQDQCYNWLVLFLH